MVKDDLLQCREAAKKVRQLKDALRAIQSGAGALRSVRYTDAPHSRGEPLSPQQAHVERCEEKEIEIEKAMAVLRPLRARLRRAIAGLPEMQYKLIWYYYGCGLKWDEVNALVGVNKNQSEYQVRIAFKKILKST